MTEIYFAPSRPLDMPADLVPSRAPQAFHQQLPGYAPTPLVDSPELAALLGVGRLWIKDESSRLELPAFKILGASWAVAYAIDEWLRQNAVAPEPWRSVEQRAQQLAPLRPLMLAAATDGNHGRAVARMARLLGLDAHIFVPTGTAQARIDALVGEGATVTVVDGTYDDAVAESATLAGPRCLVISDTAWPGYDTIPRQVIAGYSTIFWEIDDELAARGERQPDIVVVQMGVGALAAAVVGHYRDQRRNDCAWIIGVEPTRAACILESMKAGEMVMVPGPHDSIMAGLNCGTPSPVAWPLVSTGIDAYIAIDDEFARQGMRALANAGVVAGETGAAGVGGMLALLAGPDSAAARATLGVDRETHVLVIVTEGATDPAAYAVIVGPIASAQL